MARDFSSKNVIVGAGQILIGPSGSVQTTLPTLVNKTKTAQIPENISAATDNNWYPLGFTSEGSTLAIEPTYGEVAVDQLLDVAKIFKSGMRATLATSLTEATLENLLVVLGGLGGDYADGGSKSSLPVTPQIFTNTVTNAAFQDSASAAAAAGGGLVFSGSAFSGLLKTSVATGSVDITPDQIAAAININGGALGYQPVERSICIIGPGPTPTSATKSSDRFYLGYRAVSMEAVNIAVKRDEATTFPVTFRLLPFDGQGGADGNATYGRIVDRIY